MGQTKLLEKNSSYYITGPEMQCYGRVLPFLRLSMVLFFSVFYRAHQPKKHLKPPEPELRTMDRKKMAKNSVQLAMQILRLMP